jgi:hypothetical protein
LGYVALTKKRKIRNSLAPQRLDGSAETTEQPQNLTNRVCGTNTIFQAIEEQKSSIYNAYQKTTLAHYHHRRNTDVVEDWCL